MTDVIDFIKQQSEKAFDRGSLPNLWQELAENFYAERADFVATRYLGTDFAANLMTSYPLIVRRDLANTFSSMLRPTAKDWFHIRSARPDKEDTTTKQWLEWLTGLLKNAMYDRVAQFARATKEADNDFATFGQAVIQSELYRPKNGATPHLLHRCWHLRDVAWFENETGKISTIYRKWDSGTALDILNKFPKTIHDKMKEKAEKTPFEKVKIQHIVLPFEVYDSLDGAKKIRKDIPHVSIYFDVENDCLLEEVGQRVNGYTIPRFQTVSGSQYAHSPATVAALPDSRLIQAITRVLLEAGEKATNPPMIAVEDAIRSDIGLFAGATTWVDADYDERLGEVLRPITQDTKGLDFGLELVRDIREQLKDAFYLNKLNLPPQTKEMTAYEVAQRVQEFIRNALPLFEPVEEDYNGQICETDLQILMHADADIRRSIPDGLKGSDYRFVFESPLRDAVEKVKVGQFTEALQIIAQAQGLDPSAAFVLDGKTAIREVMGATVPAKWINTEDNVEKMAANAAAAQKQQQLLEMMGKGAAVAKDAAAAGADASTTMSQLGPA
jgi:hypothetical protein